MKLIFTKFCKINRYQIRIYMLIFVEVFTIFEQTLLDSVIVKRRRDKG